MDWSARDAAIASRREIHAAVRAAHTAPSTAYMVTPDTMRSLDCIESSYVVTCFYRNYSSVV